MPEFPDITVYIEALTPRVIGHTLQRTQLNSPFLLRTATPSIHLIDGHEVLGLRRLGKRICFSFQNELWLVLHLMIAGRLHWKDSTEVPTKFSKNHLASFQFDNGLLTLTEAGTQRRASLHLVEGEDALRALDRGGIEVFQEAGRKGGRANSRLGKFIDLDSFTKVLRSENHTLKRALTDPRLFSGIGNAYSDEILWQAHLSPVKLTQKLTEEEIARLHTATRDSLREWIERLRSET